MKAGIVKHGQFISELPPKLQKTLTEALPSWLQSLEPHTERSYRASLFRFAQWLETQEAIELPVKGKNPRWIDDCITIAGSWFIGLAPLDANLVASAWAQHLGRINRRTRKPTYTRGTIANRLSALRWAVKQAARSGMIGWQLYVDIPKPKKDKRTGRLIRKPGRDMEGPSETEAVKMLGVAAEQEDPRLAVIVALILHETLREHEIRQLDYPRDVDLKAGTLQVERKKRSETETVGLSSASRQAIERLLTFRGSWPGPLLVGRGKSRVGETFIYKQVRQLGEDAGISKVVSPHRLRHTAITIGDEVAESAKISQQGRQQRSGHKDARSYSRYVDNKVQHATQLSEQVAKHLRKLREKDQP